MLTLGILSLSVLAYLLFPVIEPCDASGCTAPEDIYFRVISMGVWLGLGCIVLSFFASRGIRTLLAVTSLLLIAVWFVVAVVWSE